MPVISEITGVPRSRFGFHQPSDSDSVASSPAIPKSVSKGSLFLSSSKSNAAERDEDHRGVVVPRSLSQSFELQEDPSFWTSHNVQVIIRIRPLSNSEISLQGHNKCVRQDSCQTITWLGHPESRFTFDLIADENVTQENLFKVAGYPMVDNCMGGYNSCMFAYGQTGSGKTHTMLGDIDGGTRRHSANCGMTPRVFEHLFTRIQKEKESRRDEKLRFTCKCSFLEIYNEQILDLLDPSSANLQIREDAKKGVYVENLTELEVTSARDVMQQLLQGAANRKVAATNMNLASSRSHSVFTCIIESQWESQGVTHHRFARLNLVDLAGSERQKSSGAEGERLKEATNINKSLSTLGLVIMNLVNISNGKSLHVPYRDSKLTFLLQDSLGGNSKTIIIANISPSNCNSLETLSTLKFAQRAKFIKNNAIVNEDASGDVLAMRMQIQQLKKEISRLRGLADGGTENHETDNWAISFPGSPGSFKWEGLNGSFSPLTSGKRASQKKEFEAALVGAFRRERDKEIALQALTAENQASMHLAKQREDEIQGLKMRLRFREAGIKRLEGVASGKMSAEEHLLQEREEHMKEMEVLKNQLDRNQEATRFAMENLRLKEEIRRLKSFYEEGEQERMNEQIMTLQNKLLEALDWKLMHESDPGVVQKGSSELEMLEGSLLTSSKESTSAWNSCISEENEFLRMQAIQNQSEMETLHKKLNACLEEKEKLDRRIEDLVLELEEEKRSAKSMKEEAKQQFQASLQFTSGIPDQPSDVAPNDQTELKTIVDAIAAASQQEAEAHETAITLAKENDELRRKLKVLIEDNSKLIELYEGAVADVSKRKDSEEQKTDNLCNAATDIPDKDDVGMAKTIVHLEQQIQDLHEENERLITLYENAMQERDDYIRKFRSSGHYNPNVNEVDNCPEKLVEVDIGENLMFENLSLDCGDTNLSPGKIGFSVLSDMDESDDTEDPLKATSEENQMEVQITYKECSDQSEVQTNALGSVENAKTETKSSNITQLEVSEEFLIARNKLEKVNVKLTKAAKDLTVFGSLEMAIVEADTLSKEIEVAEKDIRIKQQETVDLKNLSSEIENRKHIVDRKISALKSSISSISSSLFYWEEREGRKRTKVDSATRYVKQKKEKLVQLQVQWDELDAAQQKAQHYVGDLRNHLVSTRSKLEEENRRKESEKVLLTIDNFDRTDAPSQRNWNFGGKAIELLKSQEERTKLQAEVKQSQEKLDIALKEVEVLKTKYEKLKTEVQATEGGISSGLQAVKEMELEFQEANQEKEMLLEMIMDGQKEVDELILEYFECVFGSDLKDGEIRILEEEQETERTQLEKSRVSMVAAIQKEVQFLQEARHPFMVANEPSQRWSLSEKMEDELQEILMDVQEAKLLLGGDCR